jgi:hypothetical protein
LPFEFPGEYPSFLGRLPLHAGFRSTYKMKSFFTIVLFAIFSAGVAVAKDESGCYDIPNYGSIIYSCSTCRKGYKFIDEDPSCDIGFQCCRGICYRED